MSESATVMGSSQLRQEVIRLTVKMILNKIDIQMTIRGSAVYERNFRYTPFNLHDELTELGVELPDEISLDYLTSLFKPKGSLYRYLTYSVLEAAKRVMGNGGDVSLNITDDNIRLSVKGRYKC